MSTRNIVGASSCFHNPNAKPEDVARVRRVWDGTATREDFRGIAADWQWELFLKRFGRTA